MGDPTEVRRTVKYFEKLPNWFVNVTHMAVIDNLLWSLLQSLRGELFFLESKLITDVLSCH